MVNISIAKRFDVYARLMRIDKPIGTYLVSWPMLWALWIAANGHPDASLVVIFLLGAFLMRSAGCVINDYADRNIDAHITRTQNRPLATGEASTKEALLLFTALIFMALLLVLLLNTLTILLACVAAFLAVVYPFMKRFTQLPQIILGIAFAWSIPMAFAATNNNISWFAWWLMCATILWVVTYDTMYALVDKDDDLRIGVKSTAILFGKYDRIIIAALQVIMLLVLLLLGRFLDFGIIYYLGLFVTASLFAYQQLLIITRQREACFRAFLNNNYAGLIIFTSIFLEYRLH
ncbi:MAG: 4-hydroxybenzoate octaprenyltransferase [Mariprofundales bacterium]